MFIDNSKSKESDTTAIKGDCKKSFESEDSPYWAHQKGQKPSVPSDLIEDHVFVIFSTLRGHSKIKIKEFSTFNFNSFRQYQ